MNKILLTLTILLFLSSCQKILEEAGVVTPVCEDVDCKEGKCIEDDEAYSYHCECNEGAILTGSGCITRPIYYPPKPFDDIENPHLFGSLDYPHPRKLEKFYLLYIADLDNPGKTARKMQYKHSIDDPVLYSKTTNKFYFYDQIGYTGNLDIDADTGNGGLIEIDPQTGEFKTLYENSGHEILEDITKDDKLIFQSDYPCSYTKEDGTTTGGTKGRIYDTATRESEVFCYPGAVKDVQYNDNGKVYIDTKGSRRFGTEIYEMDIETKKFKFIIGLGDERDLEHYQTTNFVTFNYNNLLYTYIATGTTQPYEIDVVTGEKRIVPFNITETMGTDEIGIGKGWRLGNNMYLTVFTYDLHEYVWMRCSFDDYRCEKVHDAGQVQQIGYHSEHNMLSWGFFSRAIIWSLNDDSIILPITGKINERDYE
jgi:hypothetical protein